MAGAAEEAGWRRIAADIAQRIRAGEYAPGMVLPSIPQIVADYGATESMARRAIQELRVDGLAITKPGIGTFVAHDLPPPSPEFIEVMRRLDEFSDALQHLQQRFDAMEAQLAPPKQRRRPSSN